MPGNLRSASSTVKTHRGPVTSSWTKTDKILRLNVTIPVNSKAEVHLPLSASHRKTTSIKENDTAIWQDGKFIKGVQGVANGRVDGNHIIFDIGSGDYQFIQSL